MKHCEVPCTISRWEKKAESIPAQQMSFSNGNKVSFIFDYLVEMLANSHASVYRNVGIQVDVKSFSY